MYKRVDICGVNTAQLPRVTDEQADLMLRKIKSGDKDTKDEFVRANLRLVLSVIQKFSYKNDNIDDIFQIGCIGLIKAIDNFDFKYHVKFSTYAVPMIIGEIRRFLRDSSALRVSRTLKDIAYKALKIRENDTKKEYTNEEIAQILGVNLHDVDEAIKAVCEPCSIYEPVYNDNGESAVIMDQISDGKNTETVWVEDISLNEAISHLAPKEKDIINLRYYYGKTQMQVADKIGISQAQVSRIEKNALTSIKSSIDCF